MMRIILTHISIKSVGLLTLIYIDFLNVVARPRSSLPIMLKFSGVDAVFCLGAVHMDG